jgi:D-beta-D-heptose 7-phosphate kinase / D-beta-D-heptose 1-phosphate adenosyltransferase
MNIIDQFLEKNRTYRPTIHCVGDAMVDEYYEGVVNRISPEFPMPILTSTTDNPIRRPGGIANVGYQLKNFNVEEKTICFSDFNTSLSLFEHDSLRIKRSISVSIDNYSGQIPVKERYLSNGIQVFRHDIEKPDYGLSKEALAKLHKSLYNSVKKIPLPDVAILSDYNKGFFSYKFAERWNEFYRYEMWGMQNHNKGTCVTIVDPKTGPLCNWSGCSIFKPNAKEARELTGETNPREQVAFMRRVLGESTKIAITMGGDGVFGWDEKYFEYKPTKKVHVDSAIGAGDCFVAILALATAHKMPLIEAVEVAYRAGEIYVQNNLNRPVVPAELSTSKIVQPEDLLHRDFKLVFTNGCFDGGLTSAHVEYLNYAKSLGHKLVVAVNSDESVKTLKGSHRPVFDLQERMKVLSGLGCVDFVTHFEEETPLNIIQKLMPAIIVKGGDYRPEDVVGYGLAEVVVTKKFDTTSTTEKIRIIAKKAVIP